MEIVIKNEYQTITISNPHKRGTLSYLFTVTDNKGKNNLVQFYMQRDELMAVLNSL